MILLSFKNVDYIKVRKFSANGDDLGRWGAASKKKLVSSTVQVKRQVWSQIVLGSLIG